MTAEAVILLLEERSSFLRTRTLIIVITVVMKMAVFSPLRQTDRQTGRQTDRDCPVPTEAQAVCLWPAGLLEMSGIFRAALPERCTSGLKGTRVSIAEVSRPDSG